MAGHYKVAIRRAPLSLSLSLSPDFDLLPSPAAGDLFLMLRRVEAREEMALLSDDTEEGPEEGPPGWP